MEKESVVIGWATTYIIFICPFDPFKMSRHIYTFRNLCMEDKGLELNDKTTKVFVNSKGTADDVAPDVKAFLDYVNGVISDDAFVREIDDEILRVKRIEKEKVSYMTYAMKLAEEREEGRAEGREEGKIEIVQEMLRAHQPLEFIAKISKFSQEKVAEIGRLHGLL